MSGKFGLGRTQQVVQDIIELYVTFIWLVKYTTLVNKIISTWSDEDGKRSIQKERVDGLQ